LFLSSTRVIFAAAFDRILPERASYVSEKRHVPVWGMVLMLAPSLVVSGLYAYTSEFKKFILDAALVIAVTFFGTLIAAMILPWRKRELYQNSPIAKYQVAGVPVLSITSALAAIFLGWNIEKWLTNSTLVRKSQGIDLKMVYGEIPVE
jgi:APA family basic amino acid/polyamine antiporter